MKKTALLGIVALASVASTQAQTTIAQWTFETSAPVTAGPVSPEVGSGSALGLHAGAATYSSPAGNGSAKSFSANTWAVGDYWQFQVSTVGFSNIGISYDQVGSGTGPGSFDLTYSTDGVNFSTFVAAYTVLANTSPNAWSATPANHITSTTFFDDFSSVLSLNNASTVYFRIVDHSTLSTAGGTVAAAGTDRIDNFTVLADVPEPGTLALTGLGLASLLVLRRRKS
jgi:hypothetical protein